MRLDDILTEAYAKALRRQAKFTPKTLWAEAPPGVRPVMAYTRKVPWQGCVRRRRGYLIAAKPEEFKLLSPLGGQLSKEVSERLEERWLRGAMWLPLRLIAVADSCDWRVQDSPDHQVATFLEGKGIPTLYAQVFEKEDFPATEEKCRLFKRGIEGFGKRVEVSYATIVV